MKNVWIILIVIVLVLGLSKVIKPKISPVTSINKKKMFTPEDAKEAILIVKDKYGRDIAQAVERIFRLETGHFKSGQYQKTGSAGMEVGKWKDLPKEFLEPYTVKMEDADKSDGIDEFIVWKHPKYFAIYLAEYIKRYNGNWARWNSTNVEKQKKYAAVVNSIKPKFVV